MRKGFIFLWRIVIVVTAQLLQNTHGENGKLKNENVLLIFINLIFFNSSMKDLVFIGSFKTLENSTQVDQRFDENDYFISVNPVSLPIFMPFKTWSHLIARFHTKTVWSSAADDCRNILGPNGGLLDIGSLEEWQFLIILLESYGFGNVIKTFAFVCSRWQWKFYFHTSGTTFWTSGKFDIFENEWIWSINNQPIPSDSPWDVGHPSTTPNLSHRILIFHRSRYDASWRSVTEVQLNRYICVVIFWIQFCEASVW